MNSNLGPYVTSAFSRHGLLAMVGIVARPGLMFMAISNGIETYAAANVFWSVGSVGVGFVHTVLVLDLTSKSSFRWDSGASAIIFPYFSASICVVLWLDLRKVKRQGLVPDQASGARNTVQSIIFCLNEFDGMLLLRIAMLPWKSLKGRTILGAALTASILFVRAGDLRQIPKACFNETIIICEQLTVMSVVPHNQGAVMLALVRLATSVRSSIGRAISGGIWTNQPPLSLLTGMLPADQKPMRPSSTARCRCSCRICLASPTRNAIIAAYGDVQRKLDIAGSCLMPLALGVVFFCE
ncbi:uncharacterized protein PgNI_03592 [Pyricularia grisea]|uniref:Uncharacterized protein n=1 Tax=Pyricularia grisea TaxID=148305 RepID=A0A6P8BBP5_PYRGI|nr:uncharacterized protein PgNI_03592 [Pyricularia grisea]TLD13271.1 hypothetical protein PgNI_03592 [Pyricularia grisea]